MATKRFVEVDGAGRVIGQVTCHRDSWDGIATPPALIDVTDLASAQTDIIGCVFDTRTRQFGPKPPAVVPDRLAGIEAKLAAIAAKVGVP